MIDEERLDARLRKLEETVEAHARRIGEVDHKAGEFDRHETKKYRATAEVFIIMVIISVFLLIAERLNLF